MRSLNDTLTRLAALRGRPNFAPRATSADRLTDLGEFGSNPGALRARFYVPDTAQDGAALVVVLHGCTQDAACYDRGSGWSGLADEQGFALLFPEQQRTNNMNLCFNWFKAEDTQRGSGEALSIRQMIAAMIAQHRLDPARVFVTGLSAGGAMTSALLATYPEVFAGGAIIAGLPYGTARSVPEAFDRMRAQGGPDGPALGGLVETASDYHGPWPTISVWHGDSDGTVNPANAAFVVEQWRALHRVGETPTRIEEVAGYPRRVWRNADGQDVIEEYRIDGMGHGTPLSTSGPEACGVAGSYMLDAGISSTRCIARFWGLLEHQQAQSGARPAEDLAMNGDPAASPRKADAPLVRGKAPAESPHEFSSRIIENAFRTAGLIR